MASARSEGHQLGKGLCKACWGGDKVEGKAQKRHRNGVGGLLAQPNQDFTSCPQCSCPNAHV